MIRSRNLTYKQTCIHEQNAGILRHEYHLFPTYLYCIPQQQWQHQWPFFFFFFCFYLKRNQESNCLHRVVASVNIVSHEEVVCVWRLPPNLKQLHQVMKLAVDISTDCHRTPHLLHIGLLCQDFLGLN